MVLGYTFHTMKAVLSSKGELVIPGSLLKRYGLRAGATVVLEHARARLPYARITSYRELAS